MAALTPAERIERLIAATAKFEGLVGAMWEQTLRSLDSITLKELEDILSPLRGQTPAQIRAALQNTISTALTQGAIDSAETAELLDEFNAVALENYNTAVRDGMAAARAARAPVRLTEKDLLKELKADAQTVAEFNAARQMPDSPFASTATTTRLLNPTVRNIAANWRANFIVEVSANQAEVAMAHVRAGLEAGLNERTIARNIKTTIGLTERQSAIVASYSNDLDRVIDGTKTSLKDWGITDGQILKPSKGSDGYTNTFPVDRDGNPTDGILNRRLRDRRWDRTMQNAVYGTDQQKAQARALLKKRKAELVENYSKNWKRYRGNTIARTEAQRLAGIAQHEGWKAAEQNLTFGRMVKTWATSGDSRVRNSHRAAARRYAKEPLPLNAMFESPDSYGQPALVPAATSINCRCMSRVKVVFD
ncbi:hypothetical protein BXY66_3872 [Shimia isoporae]|uniref:Phage Mu protein F like protein n=1 Tax=Shimia isoporae TaxID=647720 RepID=A0A4V2Q1V8_9RHOB|nr:hypothetical protein [Shimia isoporae]TCK99370.1 hypothetical protein BXY66_3872 [Shimia isoporae]